MNGVVLFTQRVEVVESYGERRDCADQRIAEFINSCGYIPVPVPNQAQIVTNLVETIHPVGIVLTGGNSLLKYGGNAPERDETDFTLIDLAIKKMIPLYGFCRGMQSILDYFDCPLENVEGHVAVRHVISGLDAMVEVNSYHNQACKTMTTSKLEIVMKTEDGVIEKIRHKTLPIVGTMWHPEREKHFTEYDMNLVKKLFNNKFNR